MKLKILVAIMSVILISGCTQWYKNYGIQDKAALSQKSSIPKLIEAMGDSKANVRIGAMRQLLKFGDGAKVAIPNFILALNDNVANVRIYAARSLAKFGPDAMDAVDKLKDMAANDEIDNVRHHATGALNKILISTNPTQKNYIRPVEKNLDDGTKILISAIPKFVIYNGHFSDRMAPRIGVIPIELRVNNISNQAITLETDKITLIDPDKRERARVDKNYVIENSPTPMSASWIPTLKGKSQKVGDRWEVFEEPEKWEVDNVDESDLRSTPMIEFYYNHELKSNAIGKGYTNEGLIFYQVPKNTISLEGWSLVFEIRGVTGELYSIEHDFSEALVLNNKSQEQVTQEEVDQEEVPFSPDKNVEQKDLLSSENESIPAEITSHRDNSDPAEVKLMKIKELYEKGLITKEEYDQERKEVLDAM